MDRGGRFTSLKVAIVGAGISGLTLALQLYAAGYKNVTIYESADRLLPLGVGLNLQPSAVLVLRDLGLLPELQRIAISCRELIFFDRHGNQILQEARGEAAGYEIPQLSIHRGQLQFVLLEAVKRRLGDEAVQQDCALQSFDQKDDAAILNFTNSRGRGWYVHADVLVGADGINSTVRRCLHPEEGEPQFSGRMLWRGCYEGPSFLSGASMMMAGHARQFFLAYPISNAASQRSGQNLINWVCCLRTQSEEDPNTKPPQATKWTIRGGREMVREAFRSWDFGFLKVSDVIDATEVVWEFPMCDRDPIPKWTHQRVTLIGDAAHPMLPVGGNGATQSILDTESLAQHLRACSSVREALESYETERLPPTSKIVFANRGSSNNEYVMELVHQRAPSGFKNIHDVVSAKELAKVGDNYRRMTGADKEKVNRLARKTAAQGQRDLKSHSLVHQVRPYRL